MGRDGTPELTGGPTDETADDREPARHPASETGRLTRRRVLAGTTGAGITLLAGCGGGADGPAGSATGPGAGDAGDPAGYGEGGYGNGGFGV
ncbi:hypothetical protein [Haloarchaeobius sp. HME9146]|uniref:hypothetical protein n=1 Tax=Haloarchaeobius sp. HME9146 TaxID=2978732 RepID=UPI0021C1332F|nr:hypothetical protein [Haloarchaeobius sp. HME9146]MCT9096395.1 hypothetical protein [Haloarchaeobius sp. HME9146]